ncbi:RagB/SusD family nutrient uptake outer membrane protein [Parapedobacter sp. 10938]|uniref:RagB/SusD family nutrient uptake outer membrane protein n=1 Tax=Parapedobacter flavus TaxID=3110225 RepID=UPI002DB9E8AB|nr:RagB/SusD family nutrient uptake outer membrane protein [Parapedobacter sp. 10938]MEC3879137.1 RagB/SusD family nutrient uptake outer membrane protein [Parapedobacter sp. 10938]
MMNSSKRFYLLCFTLACFASCGTDFLDVKPNIRQRVPSELGDYSLLLDNTGVMNVSAHALGMIGSDEYYLTDAQYSTFPDGALHNYQIRAYTWEKEIFQGNEAGYMDWNNGYKRILWANLVIDGISRLSLTGEEKVAAEHVRGMALFHRAWNYYSLAQLFCPVYDDVSSEKALGLPLRLEPDLTLRIPRSTLAATYSQIIRDLTGAASVLPETASTGFTPTRAAAHALFARLYLQMGNYQKALDHASKCLETRGELLDYRSLEFINNMTFRANGTGNPEVIFMAIVRGDTNYLRMLRQNILSVDSVLLESYAEGDLRRQAFYRLFNNVRYTFRGSYDGTSQNTYFSGLAVDEVYLTRAECAVRLGDLTQSLIDLNTLRRHRYVSEGYVDLTSGDGQQVLDWVLEERRKELVFRGTRWEDLRRLNKEPRYTRTLERRIAGQIYTLEPGSLRYVYPLPVEAIVQGGYEQNDR